ncbi:glycine oxidase ThiO [Tsukamurella sp. 8F]|uniref:glycine oxidase ThiO n=1 Tax=unclassified Tsukamurella TaxID=2633480 RepID=UPI0023B91DC2|nr:MULTISPECIES: glycine oxidase ThiO [unclassified Tsukamurella]MDF0529530.1 glycine oxidase ThiO [Tsukamurella sp. 8J]MDF0585782.1 glycine oxidase ThiO [Tsukamurella sp. 8F]
MASVGVVGAGTVGLSVAWALARSGCDVTVFDPEPGSGASWVAGGMLAPYSEAWPGEQALLDLGIESLRLWPGFAGELAGYADGELFTARGTVWLAADGGDAQELATMVGAASGGLSSVAVPEAMAAVPGAGQRVRAAATAPDELAVDNRAVYRALTAACAAAGVRVVCSRVESLRDVPGDHVILCAGADSGALAPELGVRPVKGEVVRLRAGHLCLPPPTVTVRAKINGRAVYVVPRSDGVVVGATQYEHDHDRSPLVGPVIDLLQDAFTVLPFLREYELAEVSAGLRPGTDANVPVIDRIGGRVIAATGHGRNGILLAPVTAARVCEMVTGSGAPVADSGAKETAWS